MKIEILRAFEIDLFILSVNATSKPLQRAFHHSLTIQIDKRFELFGRYLHHNSAGEQIPIQNVCQQNWFCEEKDERYGQISEEEKGKVRITEKRR